MEVCDFNGAVLIITHTHFGIVADNAWMSIKFRKGKSNVAAYILIRLRIFQVKSVDAGASCAGNANCFRP